MDPSSLSMHISSPAQVCDWLMGDERLEALLCLHSQLLETHRRADSSGRWRSTDNSGDLHTSITSMTVFVLGITPSSTFVFDASSKLLFLFSWGELYADCLFHSGRRFCETPIRGFIRTIKQGVCEVEREPNLRRTVRRGLRAPGDIWRKRDRVKMLSARIQRDHSPAAFLALALLYGTFAIRAGKSNLSMRLFRLSLLRLSLWAADKLGCVYNTHPKHR